ncbi:hypothetical protein [Pelagibius marinus]|uniref:hypothetical protein n=1 Tax=Pelagibius marinus TaxID=2762760 RepID=UPI0018727607|nr:hypothetical protein [Pelagibius marinus]
MTEDERWELITRLDEELLVGGVIISEWCSFIVREADTAFAKGANLAAILTSTSGIETHLRAEYGEDRKQSLFDLIENSPIDSGLKSDLHKLRKYRNKWVHVGDPLDDSDIQIFPEKYEQELENMAFFAAKALRRTVYENQFI